MAYDEYEDFENRNHYCNNRTLLNMMTPMIIALAIMLLLAVCGSILKMS